MTTALIVGGDSIQSIRQVLANLGVTRTYHWSGRKVGDVRKVIPSDTQLIVLITDWVSHNIQHHIKQSATKRGVRIIYSKNAASALVARLVAEREVAEQEGACMESFMARFLCQWARVIRINYLSKLIIQE